MVLEVKTFARGQDWRTSENLPEWALQPQALDIYKSKPHIDCYKFIQQYKNYLTPFEF